MNYPNYTHKAPPPEHPRPWWYQAMAYMWYRVGMDLAHSQGKRIVVQARVHEVDFTEYIIATGGNEPRKMYRWWK